ncbi:MAG: hypothetical protein NTY19_18545 [Planctomycetota bacterium]|nr:hypothetical protein [Planctomycetota bacterium]
MIHQFTARLATAEAGPDTTALAERLYSIANDALLASRGGEVFVAFDRDADTLEQAVRSALADITRAGARVLKIEIEHEEFAVWLKDG